MKTFKFCLGVIIISVFLSCDKDVGTDGVVVDNVTGERLEGVTVTMRSKPEDVDAVTDSRGYFNTFKAYSCGLSTCDSDYTIQFSKEGYETVSFNENYKSSSLAEYVTPSRKDTLIVKLAPAQ